MKLAQLFMATALTTVLGSTMAFAQISSQQATSTATNYVGGGTVTDVDFKGSYYEVDVRKADGQKHEVKINAQTGKVISSKLDGKSRQQYAKTQTTKNAAKTITAQQAATIAANHVGGRAVDVDFERKSHGNFYDVEVVKNNGQKYDVRINAATGKIEYSKYDGYDD